MHRIWIDDEDKGKLSRTTWRMPIKQFFKIVTGVVLPAQEHMPENSDDCFLSFDECEKYKGSRLESAEEAIFGKKNLKLNEIDAILMKGLKKRKRD